MRFEGESIQHSTVSSCVLCVDGLVSAAMDRVTYIKYFLQVKIS